MPSSSRTAAIVKLVPLLFPLSLAVTACDRGAPAASTAAPASTPAARTVLDQRQVVLVLAALAEAPSHGFRAGMFGETGLAEQLQGGGDEAQARLRQAIVAYARALHGDAIPFAAFDKNWGLKPAAYDARAEFDQAVAQGRLEDWLKSLPPSSPRYQALRAAYLSYARILAAGGWRPLAAGEALRPGARGPQVAALRQRLAVEDAAAAASDPAGADLFDDGLTQAIQRAQLRYGLNPSGLAGPQTLAALNVPVEDRLVQIRAGLERLRWLARSQPPTRIEVNSAAGLFDLYRDGQPAMHMLAAAGKPGDETPILTSAIDTVVLNPAWNVPDDIADKEILPRAAREPGYFARENFIHNPHAGVKIIQKPGPKNALGQVKFLFPNPYSVYLHDTPSRAAFSRSQRSVSHGCVRLERAVDLAKLVLSGEADWTPERIDALLAGDDTTTVRLHQSIPVTIIYMTAFPVDGGGVGFRPDVYGWDTEVLRLLDAAGSRHA